MENDVKFVCEHIAEGSKESMYGTAVVSGELIIEINGCKTCVKKFVNFCNSINDKNNTK